MLQRRGRPGRGTLVFWEGRENNQNSAWSKNGKTPKPGKTAIRILGDGRVGQLPDKKNARSLGAFERGAKALRPCGTGE